MHTLEVLLPGLFSHLASRRGRWWRPRACATLIVGASAAMTGCAELKSALPGNTGQILESAAAVGAGV